ncbi:Anti-anti-sigma regulatory factor (antagonist of anti-sigma factor) [Gracilibacillus orientalis]|uniref:Anti-anti-sigma regulatory factor (Antagonist of anti-sigma factor) n=1 Tax=Gracilibacillus orientalis TaxID=334253 RepID=A0A1I4JVU7_9BACI|nr:STAS domain-containing protein [Gracilibacillus orientalis]SFL70652.1 Anti-anti-sigma regulatory factor (antagonist of anti-sigma factor) [Gracilibacillus orientalis]
MTSIGTLSSIKDATKILEAIGENIIVANVDYNIVWMNPKAVSLLENVISFFNIDNVEDLIGTNMDHFHRNPDYQKKIMDDLLDTHTSRINIKDEYIADIIINPIKNDTNIVGYVVMLMDVTTVVEEEQRKEKIIQELSGPILNIWDNTLAIPILGTVDRKLFNIILKKLLRQCEQEDTEYVIIDFSGIEKWNKEIPYQINEMISCLSVMGIHCLMVGIKPDLAQCLTTEKDMMKVPKFGTTKAAIKHIISQ